MAQCELARLGDHLVKLSRRVSQVWNWLPAFRAVAEVEHLPTASKDVNLSPSALSRSVRLLEVDLGVELFAREGRQLELTTAGRRLLGATRSAMRTVESAVDGILSSESAGEVHISAPGPYCSVFVLPALRRLRAEYPALVAHLCSVAPSQREHLLVDGGLDIAIADAADARPELRVTKLGELGYSVYASDAHPLTLQMDVSIDELLQHPFVGPPRDLSDHWPPHLQRHVAMVVEQLHVAVQACAVDGLLAILPDVVAREYRGDGALVRLPVDIVPPQPLYAISRRAAAEPKRIDIVLRALATTVEDVKRGAPRLSTMPPARSTLRPPPLLEGALAAPRAPRDLAAGGGPDDPGAAG
jgi:DNA-binding transcriptional LysR family regulator